MWQEGSKTFEGMGVCHQNDGTVTVSLVPTGPESMSFHSYTSFTNWLQSSFSCPEFSAT